MHTRPILSDRERQRRELQRAMSIRTFCKTYDIGRTSAYTEIRAGRLKVRKVGRRTIITADDAEEWLSRLPELHGAIVEFSKRNRRFGALDGAGASSVSASNQPRMEQ